MRNYKRLFQDDLKKWYFSEDIFSGPPRDLLEEFLFVNSRLEHKSQTLFATRDSYGRTISSLVMSPKYTRACFDAMYKEINFAVFEYRLLNQMLNAELIRKEKKSFISSEFIDSIAVKSSVNLITLKSVLVRNAKIALRKSIDELANKYGLNL